MAEKTIDSNFYPLKREPLQVGDRNVSLTYDPDNGDTKLYEIVTVGGVQTSKVEIYKNGVWSFNSLSLISDPERIKTHDKILDIIPKARQGKGVLPAFVKNKEGSKDQVIGGGTADTGPQGILNKVGSIIGAMVDPIGALTPFDVSGSEFEDPNEKRLFGNTELLTYPYDMLVKQQDRLEITQYRYKPTGADSLFNNPTNVVKYNIQRISPLSAFIGMAILPIPNNAADSNNVSWGPDEMNAMTAGATGHVMKDMAGTVAVGGLGGLLGGLINAVTGKGGVISVAKAALQTGMNAKLLSDSTGSNSAMGALSSGFASLALKASGHEVSPESIMARGFGIVPNSNMELLFNSPTLRDFTFAYRLSPRSKKEARNVKRIIRFFKQGMAPRKQKGQAGERSYFLGTPNVFKLRYKTGINSSISALNKFKVCALTGFSVNYSPDNNWTAYDEGQPVSVSITLQFKEIEPIYNTDYKTSIFEDRNDLDKVEDDDVGY
jgi:hypothetical protein